MISVVEGKSTMRKETTKDRILGHGAQIIHHKGFKNTGIQEILHSAGVPKGSFYFYFKSKEDFGLELIDYYFNFFASMIESHLKGPEVSFEKASVPLRDRPTASNTDAKEMPDRQSYANWWPQDTFQDKLRHALNKMKDAECLIRPAGTGDRSRSRCI
jgi:AcrR family transcriptional regulator